MALGQGTAKTILHQIISRAPVTAKGMGVAAQARNLRFEHSGEILHRSPPGHVDVGVNAPLAGVGMYGR